MKSEILENYAGFTHELASLESKDLAAFIGHLEKLNSESSVNLPLLLTAGIGIGSEGGEVEEIVKKVFFQGKPLDDETIFHLKREAGDVLWYLANLCNALGFTLEEIIEENVKKLEARYPGGKFDVWHSENRKEGDL